MQSITVSVSALYHAVAQISNDRVNYVELTIYDAEDDSPAYLCFEGIDPHDSSHSIGYDFDIEESGSLS